MGLIQFEKVNLTVFWEKTPTALKYILVFAIFIVVSYFLFSKRMDNNQVREIETMKYGITATYELIDNFDEFRLEQDLYNKEILEYLNNLHALVEDLNATTNRKLDMILNSEDQNSEQIIEKILLLNESFEKLSKAYSKDIERPNLDDNKIRSTYGGNIQFIPVDKDGNPILELKIGVKENTSKDKK